jgi:predicted RNA binding protein YcfA (HicA-like mRNA interferase family)
MIFEGRWAICLAVNNFLCDIFLTRGMKADKLKQRLIKGNFTNWSFQDAYHLARHCGWENTRTSGSHHIFTHPQKAVPSLNLQNKNGETKPYQMRQMKEQIESHQL